MDLVEELFGESQLYEEESFEAFERRYEGFGKDLYSIIRQQLPLVFNHLKFYTHRNQHEDSFAVYSNGDLYFAIVLDYYGVICIWNKPHINYETGDWSETPYEDALNYLKGIFETRKIQVHPSNPWHPRSILRNIARLLHLSR